MERDVSELLRQLKRERFCGVLEIKLEDGQAVLLRKTETSKPLSYRHTRGEADAKLER
jgi:hypothetical protein